MSCFRLVALDLDGTLLTSEKTIDPAARDFIISLKSKGVQSVIVTGRMYPTALPYAREIGQTLPLTCLNGTMIRCVQTGRTLYHNPLGRELGTMLLKQVEPLPVHVLLYDGDLMVMKKVPDFLVDYLKRTPVRYDLDPDLISRASDELSQILLAGTDEAVENVYHQLLRENSHQLQFFFYPSMRHNSIAYLEIKKQGDNKGRGVRMICKELGIPKDEVLAIGDYDNDLALFQEAGFRIAMKNASNAVKAAADYITLHTNDEGGVMEALEHAFP